MNDPTGELPITTASKKAHADAQETCSGWIQKSCVTVLMVTGIDTDSKNIHGVPALRSSD